MTRYVADGAAGDDERNTNGERTMSRTYHFDGLGSTMALTDEDGDVTDRYAYDEWGNLTGHTGPGTLTTDNPYQYVGRYGYYTHYQEPDFGLLQLGVRYYDPTVGRFTQIDPARDGINWYAYAVSDPLGTIDPQGLMARPVSKMSCDELADLIDTLADELEWRWNAMHDDAGWQYEREHGWACVPEWVPVKRGTWSGHQQQYYQKQKRLRDAMDEFDIRCSGHTPPRNRSKADEYREKKAPAYPERERLRRVDPPIQDTTWQLVPCIAGILRLPAIIRWLTPLPKTREPKLPVPKPTIPKPRIPDKKAA